MHKSAAVALIMMAISFSALAVDGIAISTLSDYTFADGGRRGHIYRFIITNSRPDGGTRIFTSTSSDIHAEGGRCANISPDASQVAFIKATGVNNRGRIWVIGINGGTPRDLGVDIPDNVWLDWPHQNWIYYTTGFGDGANRDIRRINPQTLVNEKVGTVGTNVMQMSISQDLTRGVVVRGPGYGGYTFLIGSGGISNETARGGCGASISPGGLYLTTNHGDHATVTIHHFESGTFAEWGTGRCSGAGGNWNRQRWSSNSEDWVTFTQGHEHQLGGGHHQVLYHKDGSNCIQVQPLQGGVFWEGDDFWVGNPGQSTQPKPELNFDKSELRFEARAGEPAPAAQTVAVSNGGDGTLPTLTAQSSKTWLRVSVSGGDNAYTVSNQVDINGLPSGVHEGAVSVSGSGVTPVSYRVVLTLSGVPELTAIAVVPNNPTATIGESLTLSAEGRDQTGSPIALGAVSWSVSPQGASIDALGHFSGSTMGTYTVSATFGQISGTTTVTVKEHMPAVPVTVVAPNGGETYAVGEPIVVSWKVNTDQVGSVAIKLSLDNGDSWTLLTREKSVATETVDGSWQWTPTLATVPQTSTQCLFRIEDYTDDGTRNDESDAVFTISSEPLAGRARARSAALGLGIQLLGGVLSVQAERDEPFVVGILNARGQTVRTLSGRGHTVLQMNTLSVPPGLYVIEMKSNNRVWQLQGVSVR